MIRLPHSLQPDFPMPEHMPFMELAISLAERGYYLKNTGTGDLQAVPIDPCEHEVRRRWGGFWICDHCAAKFTDSEIFELYGDEPDHPSNDRVCNTCGQRQRNCYC